MLTNFSSAPQESQIMRKFLLLFALIACLMPSLASANEPVDGLFGQAAMSYWGVYPGQCGYINVYHWTWDSAAGHSDPTAGNCKIWINAAAFSSWPAGRACMIFIHEWGHLLGYGHSSNPADVMYYGTDPWNNIPYVRWPCNW